MELTRSIVRAEAEAYRDEEPLYAVGREQVETLPGAFERGAFGRRDAEWIVRWDYRRFLGDYPGAERRTREEWLGRNGFERVVEAIEDAAAATEVATALDRLVEIEGVDVPVASAFLTFIAPEEYVVVGERGWTVLRNAGELHISYPAHPDAGEYEAYLGACRSLADRLDCDLWSLYRALWRFWKENSD